LIKNRETEGLFCGASMLAADTDVVAPHWVEDGSINRWRYRAGTDRQCIEIELTQGKVAVIDSTRFEEVQQHNWHVTRVSTKTGDSWYAGCKAIDATTGKRIGIQMHVLLFPQMLPPRDHINNDGLDNRQVNLRTGACGINARNQKNVIGVTKRDSSYGAIWTDVNGHRRDKSFLISAYESPEAAYDAAVAYRKDKAASVLNELHDRAVKKQEETIINVPTVVPPPRTKANTVRFHVKGLSYVAPRQTRTEGIYCRVVVNGKAYTRKFPVSHYDNSLEQAVEAGKIWLAETRAAHPREKKAKTDE